MKAIWITQSAEISERAVPGTFEQAVAFLKGLAEKADFVFGQVLAEDGKVLENVACNVNLN